MNSPRALEIQGLSKSFGGVPVVDRIDLSVAVGEMVAVIGPNGAGKSTCFNMIHGQLAPDSGSIRLFGQETVGLPSHQIWRLGVGRTFQITATFASMTVLENVQMALHSLYGKGRALWIAAGELYREEAEELLDLVGMADQAHRPCGELAYGDLKKLELAVALASDPKLLLMDEPTAGMAPNERIELMELTSQIVQERSISVLFTEHDMDVVFAHAQRIVVLNRGAIVAQGTAREVRENPEVEAIYLGSGLSNQNPRTKHISQERKPSKKSSMISRDQEAQSMVLQVKGLNSFYGRAQILRDVSLQIESGEVVALLGRNGAGKTTTLRSIVGLVPGCDGQVAFQEQNILGVATHNIAQMGVGYVPEDRRIFSSLTVKENLLVGRRSETNQEVAQSFRWTLEQLFEIFPNLGEIQHRPAGHISGGEQQMVTIARTLMGNPKLVLLDEPSEGLAPKIVEQMIEAVRAMQHQGISVLLSEQNLYFANAICDRAYILEKGTIRFDGTLAVLMQDESLRQAYLAV